MGHLLRLMLVVLIVAVTACTAPQGDGQPGGPDDDAPPAEGPGPITPDDPDESPEGPINSVSDQLRELGWDPALHEGTQRALSETLESTDEYSPLGMRARIAPMELFAAGIDAGCVHAVGSAGPDVFSLPLYDDNGDPVDHIECYAAETGDYAVRHRTSVGGSFGDPGAQSTRALAAGDFDGDGLMESVVVLALPNPAGDWQLLSHLSKAGEPDAVDTSFFPASTGLGNTPVVDVEAIVADFDGNGLDDLLVAVLSDDGSGMNPRGLALYLYRQSAPGTMLPATQVFHQELETGTDNLSVRLAAGNVDMDAQHELAVLLRSMQSGGAPMNVPDASVSFWLLDDLAAGGPQMDVIHERTLRFDTEGEDTAFITADVTIADFDADGFGEVAFTGILSFPTGDDAFCGGNYRLAYEIYDDLATTGGDFVSIGNFSEHVYLGSCASGRGGITYEVFANPVNTGGNYKADLLANNRILRLGAMGLEFVRPFSGWDINEYFAENDRHFSESNVAVAVGDFDHDGRDDVAVMTAESDGLHIYTGSGTRLLRFTEGANRNGYPELVSYDNDHDGFTVEYQRGSHHVVLTEPILIAALAAAPYSEDFGQNPSDAVTTYGTSETHGYTADRTVSFTANSTFGLKKGGSLVIVPVELSATTETILSSFVDRTEGTGYATTHTETYAASVSDSVVYTSLPYDVYDYTVVSSYDPDMLGDTFTLMLPRTPLTRITAVSYYDERLPEGGYSLSDNVFLHTAGDPYSYRTRKEFHDLREAVRRRLDGRPKLFLHSTEATVGQGSSVTSREISLSEESFHTEAVGSHREHSLSLTFANYSAGFTVGEGESESLTISSGSSTIVSGSIPSITVDDRLRPDAVYSWGLYTYMQSTGPDGQVFQVIDYYVDR